jgi:hypothetical protein
MANLRLWLCSGIWIFTLFSVSAQDSTVENLLGKWENTGSFRDGKQQLTALQDTLKNPTTYYFTFFADGTFIYDVISLEEGLKGSRRKGKWQLSPNMQRITLLDEQVRPDERKIPGDFLNFETDGSLSTKPVIYPILEFTPKKLVLYDEFHQTLDILRKK